MHGDVTAFSHRVGGPMSFYGDTRIKNKSNIRAVKEIARGQITSILVLLYSDFPGSANPQRSVFDYQWQFRPSIACQA